MAAVAACEVPPASFLAAGRTRSWLMAAPITGEKSPARTRLFFGSAIVPAQSARSDESPLNGSFRALLGFHRLYSRALLSAVRAHLE